MDNFVGLETDVLPLPNGQTVTVRRRLNTGEIRARLGRSSTLAHGARTSDPLLVGMATVTAYMLDWTVTDRSGSVMPIQTLTHATPPDFVGLEQVLNNLEPDVFGDIFKAIDAHEDAQNAKRAAEKKTIQTGGGTLRPTLPSPSAAAGGLSGSVV